MATMYRLVPKETARTRKAADAAAVAWYKLRGWTNVRVVSERPGEAGPTYWSLVLEGTQPGRTESGPAKPVARKPTARRKPAARKPKA